MRAFPVFNHLSPKAQLLLLVGLIIIGTLFSIVVAYGVSIIIWGPDVLTMMASPEGMNLNFLRTFQIINQVGIFIIPPLLFAWLISSKGSRFLRIKKASAIYFTAAIVIMLVSGPMINCLVEWNAGFKLPESLKSVEQWMRDSEDAATRLTEQFLNTPKPIDLIINLLMIGILPAIGEE